MSEAEQHETAAVAADPFSEIEAERLRQQIAQLYVLLAEALGGTPPRD